MLIRKWQESIYWKLLKRKKMWETAQCQISVPLSVYNGTVL